MESTDLAEPEPCIGPMNSDMESPRPQLPIERSQSEYSVLQVVDAEHEKLPSLQVVPEQAGDAPQVVIDQGADAPQVLFDDDKIHNLSLESNDLEVAPPDGSLPEVVPPESIPWYKNWRRKRYLAATTIIIMVAVVLGAVLGTRTRNNSPSGSDSTALRESACKGTVCPQILSAAVLGLNTTTDQKLIVFARGDGAIYFNWANISNLSSSGGWPADSRWSALLGGPFISQPTAISWQWGSRVSVAAMTANNGQVQMTRFIVDEKGPGGFTVDGWKDLGGPVGSPLGTCAINGTRADFYAVDGTKFLHNLSHRNGTVDMWKHPDQLGIAGWDAGTDLGINQTSKPGVACRPSYVVHDLVFYDDKAAVRHGMWAWNFPGNHWSEFTDLGGEFQGEPLVIAVGADRVDFFGIGQDAAMYHFTWESGKHSALESLGGSFHSAASAVVTGSGLVASSTSGDNNTASTANNIRIDVVALGTNDHIHHRVMKGTEWVSDWEDLGVVGNSAPMLAHYGGGSSEQAERAGVFVVGYDGQVKQATWTVSSEPSWKDLQWTNMGGAMTSDFYRFDGGA